MGPTGRNVAATKNPIGAPNDHQGRRQSVSKEIDPPRGLREHGRQDGQRGRQEDGNDIAGDGTTCRHRPRPGHLTTKASATSQSAPTASNVQRGVNKAARRPPAKPSTVSPSSARGKRRPDRKIATVSANHRHRESAKSSPRPSTRVGAEGVVEVEEGKTADMILDYVEGMAVRQGLPQPRTS